MVVSLWIKARTYQGSLPASGTDRLLRDRLSTARGDRWQCPSAPCWFFSKPWLLTNCRKYICARCESEKQNWDLLLVAFSNHSRHWKLTTWLLGYLPFRNSKWTLFFFKPVLRSRKYFFRLRFRLYRAKKKSEFRLRLQIVLASCKWKGAGATIPNFGSSSGRQFNFSHSTRQHCFKHMNMSESPLNSAILRLL